MFRFYIFFTTVLSPLVLLSAQEKLINIAKLNSSIVLDIRYATSDNFTGKVLYSQAACYLRKSVAEGLDKVQKELKKKGLGLKIWDGYRPRSVQYKLWKLVPDARYVQPPEKGSRHSRGAAVDLTLIDSKAKELPMGCDFDDFSPKAHRNYKNLTLQEKNNRKLLEVVMRQHGFRGLKWEWWHFDFKNYDQYDLLDISFEELEANS